MLSPALRTKAWSAQPGALRRLAASDAAPALQDSANQARESYARTVVAASPVGRAAVGRVAYCLGALTPQCPARGKGKAPRDPSRTALCVAVPKRPELPVQVTALSYY